MPNTPQHSVILPFPTHRARDAAAVRQAIRLRARHEGQSPTTTRTAVQCAIHALVAEQVSPAWAIHVGCCVLRGRPLPTLIRREGA